MRKPFVLPLVILALAGCGDGTDRPSPPAAQIQAENQQRQQSISRNPNIPASARDRVNATIGGGKR